MKRADCESCGRPTVSRTEHGRPLCRACRPKALSGNLARGLTPPRWKPKAERCSVCCAPGELAGGKCKDRAACEARQPPLISLDEL